MIDSLAFPHMRSNFRHLYQDIFWYGILSGSTMAFLAIYAARLGASGLQISLLTAGPALFNLFFSLPSGRWLEGRALASSTFRAAVLNRLGFLLFIPLPWLFNDPQQIKMVIWITLFMSIPGTLVAISFNAMFAELVPPEWRAEVVGKRNALSAISMTITTLICGQILDRIPFPLNYQVVFALGILGAILSTYHLSRLKMEAAAQPQPQIEKPSGAPARPARLRFLEAVRLPAGLRALLRSNGKPLLRIDLLKGRFGRFILAYLLFYTFQYVPLPLFPLAMVNQLRLTDGEISLGSALFYTVMTLVSLRLSRLSARFGYHRMLIFSAIGYSAYPLLLGLAQNANLYWVASLLGGLMWALLSASLINRLMEVAPEEGRPAYMALHNLALNLGILAGSITAPILVNGTSLPQALLIGAGLRLLAGLLLIAWG